MKITKLRITSLSTGCADIIINSPSAQTAARLIKERLSSDYAASYNSTRIPRKIPKFLKGFVNPEYKTTMNNKFNTIC